MRLNSNQNINQSRQQFTALKKISFPKCIENEPSTKMELLGIFDNSRINEMFKKHDGELYFNLWYSRYHDAYFANVDLWLDYDRVKQNNLLEFYKKRAKESGINPNLRFEKEIEISSNKFIEPLTFMQTQGFVAKTRLNVIKKLIDCVKAMNDFDFEKIEYAYQRENSKFFERLTKKFEEVFEKIKREKTVDDLEQKVANRVKDLIG